MATWRAESGEGEGCTYRCPHSHGNPGFCFLSHELSCRDGPQRSLLNQSLHKVMRVTYSVVIMVKLCRMSLRITKIIITSLAGCSVMEF